MVEGVSARGRADKNPRPPPGPGDAGVNGAEESAPPGSEKPTGLSSLIRAAWAGSLVEVVGIEPPAVQTTKKDAPMGHPFLLYTKRTGLEPATSAVTGLRSNQTELPLLAFVLPPCGGCGQIIRRVGADCKLFFAKKSIFWEKKVLFLLSECRRGGRFRGIRAWRRREWRT